jgi:hypothetical protein
MRRLRSSLLLLGLLSGAAHAGAPPIGYAQASSYLKKDSRPTLYQPLNLLDGRELTAWCSSSGDLLADQLTFGFKDSATIDEVRIYTGNGFDDKTFREFARGKKFALKGPEGGQTFTVADTRGLQAVALQPPITGAQFTLEVLDVYHAEDPDTPVCITDIVFYSQGKPLNGAWLTQKLKYDRTRAPLLGTWFGGDEGAPDRFLAFFYDGTFRYLYEPYDPITNTRRSLTGNYTLMGDTLTLEMPGKAGKKRATIRRSKSRHEGQKVLTLDGEDLPEDFRRAWRTHR